jgi:hypothetical protein
LDPGTALDNGLGTAERLVALLEQDGFDLQAAVFAPDDEDSWRLFLVPRDPRGDDLEQMIRVAHTMSEHRDELPDRHAIRYSVVTPDHAVIRAIKPLVPSSAPFPRLVEGVYRDGTYIDRAYVLKLA